MMQVPLSGPDVSAREIDLVNEVLGTPYLSMGPKTNEDFEFPNSNFEIAILSNPQVDDEAESAGSPDARPAILPCQ
jgi:hypothetical protein